MKRLLYLAIIVLAVILLSGPKVELAHADTPPNIRLYPNPQYPSYVVNSIKATGVATYRVVDNYGWAGWPALVSQALDTGSVYPNSLGNVLGAAVPSFTLREARLDEAPTMLQIAESAAAQQTHCNHPEGWSVASAYLLNPLPAPTYYKAATMQLYGFVSQAAVIQHETFHHVARACDQYPGGCPLAATGAWPQTVQCTGNPDTLMDCGLAARFAQPFDVDTFLLATGFVRFVVAPCDTTPPYWCDGRWRFADGGSLDLAYGNCGGFYDAQNRLTWEQCDAWGGGARWNAVAQLWLSRDGGVYNPANNAYINLGVRLPIP